MPLYRVQITGDVIVLAVDEEDASFKALDQSYWWEGGGVENIDIAPGRDVIVQIDESGEEVE